MIKIAIIILFAVAAIAFGEDEEVIELNEVGCPVNNLIFKILAHNDCDKFYKCSNGARYEFACPDGLVFNLDVNVCDWPNQVDCESRKVTTQVPVTEATVGDEPGRPEDIAGVICAREGSEGLLLPHEYCSYLYMCAHSQPVEISCPEPLFYNTKSQLCDWENDVECGDRLKGKPEVSRKK